MQGPGGPFGYMGPVGLRGNTGATGCIGAAITTKNHYIIVAINNHHILSGELKSYSCYNSTLKHYFNIIDCGDILTTDRYEYVDLKLLRKNIEHYMCYFNQWFQFYKFVKHDTVSKDIFQNIMRHYVPLRIKV
jgi:hypothetical protein